MIFNWQVSVSIRRLLVCQRSDDCIDSKRNLQREFEAKRSVCDDRVAHHEGRSESAQPNSPSALSITFSSIVQPINPIGTSDYASARSVYLHLTNLGPGRYIIMPTTYAPREQAEFMLRIYAKEDLEPKLLKKDMPGSSIRSLKFLMETHIEYIISCNKVLAVSRLKIIEATFRSPKGWLRYEDFIQLLDMDLYCFVRSAEKVRTSTVRSSYTAKWDESFIFYRFYFDRRRLM